MFAKGVACYVVGIENECYAVFADVEIVGQDHFADSYESLVFQLLDAVAFELLHQVLDNKLYNIFLPAEIQYLVKSKEVAGAAGKVQVSDAVVSVCSACIYVACGCVCDNAVGIVVQEPALMLETEDHVGKIFAALCLHLGNFGFVLFVCLFQVHVH